jgi:hypothetical protein
MLKREGTRTFVVADVDHGKVLHLVDDLVEVLVHLHAFRVAAETDADYAVFFGGYCLVDVPACISLSVEI